jgi:hypothetical protein
LHINYNNIITDSKWSVGWPVGSENWRLSALINPWFVIVKSTLSFSSIIWQLIYIICLRHDIAEILLKFALRSNQSLWLELDVIFKFIYFRFRCGVLIWVLYCLTSYSSLCSWIEYQEIVICIYMYYRRAMQKCRFVYDNYSRCI